MSAFVAMLGFSTGTGENELFAESEDLGVDERYPENDSVGLKLNDTMGADLNVSIIDGIGNNVNVTFYGHESGETLDQITTMNNLADGDWANYTWKGLEYGTEYEWYVNVTEYENEDVNYSESDTWNFTTEHIPNMPKLVTPEHESVVSIYSGMNTTLEVNVTHPEGKDLNVTFYGNHSGGTLEWLYNETVADGEWANYTWEDLDYGTRYMWNVNVTEAENEDNYTVSDTWSFTTEEVITDMMPTDGGMDIELGENMETMLKVNVSHPEGDDMNVTFYGNHSGGTLEWLYNETVADGEWANYTWEDLDYGTEYTWYVNVTEKEEAGNNLTLSEEWSFTTEHIPGKIRKPNNPGDGDVGVSIDPELNVTATHPEDEDMDLNVTFYGNGGRLDNVTVTSGEYATYTWAGLDYNTTYHWSVNITEKEDAGNNWTKSETWSFTTVKVYDLTFTVEDGEEPIESATVTVANETLDLEYTNTTNDTGVAVVEDVKEGEYTYTISKEGYKDAIDEITVEEDDYITVTMTEKVYDLTFTVEDGEGPIESATVTVANETLDLEYTNTTNDIGVAVVEDVEEGEYTYTVSKEGYKDATDEITADEDKTVTAWLEEADQPNFEVEITDYDEEVEPGQYLMVKFTVENTGEVKGTQNINFSVGESKEDIKEITLDPGENDTYKFFWEAEVGSHLLTVTSENDEDTVAVTVEAEAGTQGLPGIPGFTSLILLLATIFAVIIYHKKQR